MCFILIAPNKENSFLENFLMVIFLKVERITEKGPFSVTWKNYKLYLNTEDFYLVHALNIVQSLEVGSDGVLTLQDF